MDERAQVSIYDPKVADEQIWMDFEETGYLERAKKLVKTHPDAYDATVSADAIVVCTEWDEFVGLDYQRIYDGMRRPAFIFDGRLILDAPRLRQIGFHVETIGKPADPCQ